MVVGLMVVVGIVLLGALIFWIWRLCRNNKLIRYVTSLRRGERSERDAVLALLKMAINPKAIFHDCYLRRPSGSYTQVDLIVATPQGILVFEIKDYSGWIYGHPRREYWTQVLAYGKEKHRFYNPIKQNKSHIQALRQNLHRNPKIPIFNIIVFYGSCTLKDITVESDNDFIIYASEITSTVKRILRRPKASFGDKYEIMDVLTRAVDNGRVPSIVLGQRLTASIASINKPSSSYAYDNALFSFFRRGLRL